MHPFTLRFTAHLTLGILAIAALPGHAQAAKAKKKSKYAAPTEVTVEVPQTLGAAQQQFASYSAAAEARRRPFIETASLTVSNLVAERVTVRGSTPQLFTFDAEYPNAELRLHTRPLLSNSRVALRALGGGGFAALRREGRAQLPNGSVPDTQNLFVLQLEVGAEVAVVPFARLPQLRVSVEGLGTPALAFSGRSLVSDGRSYRAVGAQVATALKYDFTPSFGAAVKTGYRTSNLSLGEDDGFGYAVSLENRF